MEQHHRLLGTDRRPEQRLRGRINLVIVPAARKARTLFDEVHNTGRHRLVRSPAAGKDVE